MSASTEHGTAKNSAIEQALAAARDASARLLFTCASAMNRSIPRDGVLFSRRMHREGSTPMVVEFFWPHTLKARDTQSGAVFNESMAWEMERVMPQEAAFMARVLKGKPLKTLPYQPPQSQRMRISVWADGVVRVHAFKSGELLAESEPGQPTVLRAGFHSLSVQDLAPRID